MKIQKIYQSLQTNKLCAFSSGYQRSTESGVFGRSMQQIICNNPEGTMLGT